jgi:hypothetical protein
MSVEKSPEPKSSLVLAVAAAVLFAALVGASFAGWLEQGPAMLLTLGQNVLAWCF